LNQNSRAHWNRQIHSLVYNALKVFMDINPELYERVQEDFKTEQEAELNRLRSRHDQWLQLQSTVLSSVKDVSKLPPGIKIPIPDVVAPPPIPVNTLIEEEFNGNGSMIEAEDNTTQSFGSSEVGPPGNGAASGSGGVGVAYSNENEAQNGVQNGVQNNVTGGNPNPNPNQPHMRRKSVIPIDPNVLKELAAHKSLDANETSGSAVDG